MEWMLLTVGLLFGILGTFVIPLIYHKRFYFRRCCRKQKQVAACSLRSVQQIHLSSWLKILKYGAKSVWCVSYVYEINREGYIWSGILCQEPHKTVLIYYQPDDMEHAKLDAELEIPVWVQLFWPLAAVFLMLILIAFCVRLG